MRSVRVLKGIVTSAIAWGVAWVPLSVTLAGIGALAGSPLPRALWGFFLIRQVIGGALSGGVFAATLAAVGRRRTFDTLSYARIALCGAVGGVIFPAIGFIVVHSLTGPGRHGPLPVFQIALVFAVNGTMGALCAASALRIARQAPELPRLDASGLGEVSAGPVPACP